MGIMEGPPISVSNLSVSYYSLERKSLLSMGRKTEIKALENINLEIQKGELVAILGKNGSGKSTLLNTISGRLKPKKGEVITRGRVFTLRGANPGLIPQISARRNVHLLSFAYGISDENRISFEEEVESFCDLGDAYDRRFSTLSSGMAGRVGFGFTTSLDPEILLMDETLGVGDEEFRKKATRKAEEFMKRGETMLLSTHSLNLAKNMCNRGIVLHDGKLVFDGTSSEAVSEYLENYRV